MATQSERRTQTRAAIVDAAYAAFERQGTADVALEAIANGAGVTKGSIHYHFDNRAGLIRAVAVWVFAQLEQRIVQTMPTDSPGAEHYVRTLLRLQATPMGRVLFLLGDELARSGELQDIDPYRYLCTKLQQLGTTGSVEAVAAALTQFGRQLAYGLSSADEIDALVAALKQGGQLQAAD